MTEPDDRYSEEVRRALSAAADLVVPAGDGLDKIRERVVHRPVPFAWFVAYTQGLPHRIFASFRVAATGLTAIGSGGSSGAVPESRRRPHFNPESSWVRPTLAAVGALAIVAIAATVILPQLSQPVSTSAFKNRPPGQNTGLAGGSSPNSPGQQNSGSGQPFPPTSPNSTTSQPPSTQCQTLPLAASTSPSPSPTPSTYLSPSSAPGPSQTVTPPPSAAPQNFANMIGEEPPQPATFTICGNQTATGGATPPPSGTPPPSPTSPPPSSPTSPPPSSPTSTPPSSPSSTPSSSIPTPQGSVTPTTAPPRP